ncbi:hypothetical protein Hypma_015063 [Hypsizygus marmoreus]|uniref:Uncharacterized protein n=1 Tax=Hypsizygus marmoreus TaxID=39966 RepID=A0A369K3K0_HYPMA|nr:hypothetical protein Hypma_015063 [Hypsizygus marmoreus]
MPFDPSPSPSNSNTAHTCAISPSTSYVGRKKPRSRHYNRYSPYPNPQRSLYQLHVTYLDPAYVEDLVDIVMPRVREFPDIVPLLLNNIFQHPRHVLEAVLEPPPRNLRNDHVEGNPEVEQGAVHRVFAWIMRFLGFLEQTIWDAI